MKEVKYIKIGKKQYKKINVILFFTAMGIVYIVLEIFLYFNQDKFFKITPKTKEELVYLIKEKNTPLFLINTSEITDMSWLFHGGIFVNYAGIETWNVSNVENMEGMFYGAGSIYADLNLWDISKVKNMQYMFAYADNIDKEQINKWNVSDDVKYYGIFRGTELENNPPDWFKLKNEFEIKYYPESKEELISMLNNEDILAGEIDVSKVDKVTEALYNIKRYNKSYMNEYNELLYTRHLLEQSVNNPLYYGIGQRMDEIYRMEIMNKIYRDYNPKIEEMRKAKFYEKLEEPKKLIHDDYPGIEFWNTPDIDKVLAIINE